MKKNQNLAERIKQDDELAFDECYRLFHDALFRQFYYRLRDPSLAQDIVQDTFFRIWEKRHRLNTRQPLFALALKIGHDRITDHFRRSAVRQKYEDAIKELGQKDQAGPDGDTQANLLEARIIQTVNRDLPGKCRLVFLLSRIEGMRHEEIARQLGISKKTVLNHLNRALKVLRKKCKDFL